MGTAKDKTNGYYHWEKKNLKKKTEQHLWNFKNRLEKGKLPSVLGNMTSICR